MFKAEMEEIVNGWLVTLHYDEYLPEKEYYTTKTEAKDAMNGHISRYDIPLSGA